jgi:hypothetical protein
LFDKPEAGMEPAREEERIALRCSRRELQFLDSFVVSGEFSTRSELIRAALREFLSHRARAAPEAPPAPPPPGPAPLPDLVVPLRPEEREVVEAYAELVQDHAPVSSTLAELVRRGLRDGKVVEQLEATRSLVRASAERRSQAQQAAKSPEELQRQGFLGQ